MSEIKYAPCPECAEDREDTDRPMQEWYHVGCGYHNYSVVLGSLYTEADFWKETWS